MNPFDRPTGCAPLLRALALAVPLFLGAGAVSGQSPAAPAPAASPAAAGMAADADPVLISNSMTQIRRSDYEQELTRLPAHLRDTFAASKQRIGDLLSRMLVTRTLDAQAHAAKLDQDPEVAARFRAETERFYAGARVAMVERSAGAEFDARRSQMEPRARELYLADLKKWEVVERVSASHILFGLDKHSKDEALKLAQDTRARIVAGADFNDVARQVSEDSSAKRNDGRLDWFVKADMDPAFADAAFGLAKVGDISSPVLSQFGWHLIRLDGRKAGGLRPYEEVREQVFAELKKQYVDERREALINAIHNDPTAVINEAAIDALYARPMPPPAVEARQPEAFRQRPPTEQRKGSPGRPAEQPAPKN